MIADLPFTESSGCCALIAIKRRSQCKSRLAAKLSASARVVLARSMLDNVIEAAEAAQTVRQVLVLSPERDTVPAWIPVLADVGDGLNQALMSARAVFQRLRIRELLVIAADLPYVTGREIDDFVRAGRNGGFAIAPDVADVGTNALYLASDHSFEFQFGANSRQLHHQEAEEAGLSTTVYRSRGMGFDVDLPSDLAYLLEVPDLACKT